MQTALRFPSPVHQLLLDAFKRLPPDEKTLCVLSDAADKDAHPRFLYNDGKVRLVTTVAVAQAYRVAVEVVEHIREMHQSVNRIVDLSSVSSELCGVLCGLLPGISYLYVDTTQDGGASVNLQRYLSAPERKKAVECIEFAFGEPEPGRGDYAILGSEDTRFQHGLILDRGDEDHPCFTRF
jgi:hypothetical protein